MPPGLVRQGKSLGFLFPSGPGVHFRKGEFMTETLQVVKPEKKSLIKLMADKFDLDPVIFQETIKKTCFPNGQATNEQLIMFLSVANEYDLNPFIREIFAFVGKAGNLQVIASVDGWAKVINRHPQYDGAEFSPVYNQQGKLESVACNMYRKDRNHPTSLEESYEECYRPTEPWKTMPKRMLRHKAFIQAGRYAFGLSGLQDEDEGNDALKNEAGPALVTAAATETKTEALKEKIGAAKQKTGKVVEAETVPKTNAKDNAPAPVSETGSVSPSSDTTDFVDEKPKAGAPDSLFKEEPPPPAREKPVEDRIITREEQMELVDLLQSKKATRSMVLGKLGQYGYLKTQDLKLKDLKTFTNWAQSLPEPKSA